MAFFRKLPMFFRNFRCRSFATTKQLGKCCEEEHPSKSETDPCHDPGSYKLYRILSLYFAIPIIAITTIIQINNHRNYKCERPEFVPYEYLRIRTKKYPWGDGNKTLFHNPHVNALPDGYEDEQGEEEEVEE